MGFLTRFRNTVPGEKEIALFWLGQAGFLIKTSSGHTIAIDPYFSDYVMHSIPEEGSASSASARRPARRETSPSIPS